MRIEAVCTNLCKMFWALVCVSMSTYCPLQCEGLSRGLPSSRVYARPPL